MRAPTCGVAFTVGSLVPTVWHARRHASSQVGAAVAPYDRSRLSALRSAEDDPVSKIEHEELLACFGSHGILVLVDSISVVGHDAACTSQAYGDALPSPQVTAPDRRHSRPAAHVDHQVRLDEAIVDLDQVTHLVHTQVDKVILIGGVVRTNAAARPTRRPEAIDDLGRQDVEGRRVGWIDVATDLGEDQLASRHLGMQPASYHYPNVALLDACFSQLIKHDRHGVDSHPHPVVHGYRHLAGSCDELSQWLHAHWLPDRVTHSLGGVFKCSRYTVGVGAFDDHGGVGNLDLPGRAESIVDT